jgi:putative flippase GtrA
MAVGTLNGCIYFTIMYLLTSVIGIWYMLSAVIAVALQTLITFGLHRIWVWRSKKTAIRNVMTIYRFIKYCIIGGCGMVLGLCGLYVVTEVFHVYYVISMIVASFVLLICNFLANNYWTWGEGNVKELDWIVGILERMGLMPLIKRLGVEI